MNLSAVTTDRDEDTRDHSSQERRQHHQRHHQRRRIDVTELQASEVDAFVRNNVGTDHVSLEHRGARTFLVVEK